MSRKKDYSWDRTGEASEVADIARTAAESGLQKTPIMRFSRAKMLFH
jgi:hypothetical protein